MQSRLEIGILQNQTSITVEPDTVGPLLQSIDTPNPLPDGGAGSPRMKIYRDLWTGTIPWIEVSSPRFVKLVQARQDLLDKEVDSVYKSVPLMVQRVEEN